MAGLPNRTVAAYWTYWSSPPWPSQWDSNYNTMYLFHCEPVGGPPGSTGAVMWMGPTSSDFVAELQAWRNKGNCAILTVGGAHANVSFGGNRQRSQAFVQSVRGIYDDLGGFDGLDWNNYEQNEAPDTTEMNWISLELKRIYGSGFVITTPPAPWRDTDFTHCRAMIDAGALDLVSPQYYDGEGLDDPNYIVQRTGMWIDRMGDVTKVGIGFGVKEGTANYTPLQGAKEAWSDAAILYPGLKGAFDWELAYDAQQGWGFAREVGPLIKATSDGGPPPDTGGGDGGGSGGSGNCTDCYYTVVSGDTLSIIGGKTGCPWEEIAEINGITPPNYIIEVGQVLALPCSDQTPPPDVEEPPVEPEPEPEPPEGCDLTEVEQDFEAVLMKYLELGAELRNLRNSIGRASGGSTARKKG